MVSFLVHHLLNHPLFTNHFLYPVILIFSNQQLLPAWHPTFKLLRPMSSSFFIFWDLLFSCSFWGCCSIFNCRSSCPPAPSSSDDNPYVLPSSKPYSSATPVDTLYDSSTVGRYVPSGTSLVPLSVVPQPSIPASGPCIPVSQPFMPSLSSLQPTKSTTDNIHPMRNRSKVVSLQDLTVSHVSSDDLSQMEPDSIHVALSSPRWTNVVNEELSALSSNQNWLVVSLPPSIIPIGCKWLFQIRRNANGYINRYKSRVIAKEFSQKTGIDFKTNSSL